MSNKYYTPVVSEFHVGFEYELLNKTWECEVTKLNTLRNIMRHSGESEGVNKLIKLGNIRVKYLDSDDLYLAGWKQSKLSYQYFDGIHMLVDLGDNKYSITHIADEQCIYYGIIKNKTKLMILMGDLGI